MANAQIIPTAALKTTDVPTMHAPIHEIDRFALTFDVDEATNISKFVGGIDDVDDTSTLIELRLALYAEQRRWNHFGRPYDKLVENKIRDVVRFIKIRLEPKSDS